MLVCTRRSYICSHRCTFENNMTSSKQLFYIKYVIFSRTTFTHIHIDVTFIMQEKNVEVEVVRHQKVSESCNISWGDFVQAATCWRGVMEHFTNLATTWIKCLHNWIRCSASPDGLARLCASPRHDNPFFGGLCPDSSWTIFFEVEKIFLLKVAILAQDPPRQFFLVIRQRR